MLLKISLKYPEIIEFWNRSEKAFLTDPYSFPGCPLKKRIRILSALVLVFGTIEHLIALISFLSDRLEQVELCNWKVENYVAYFLTSQLSHVFSLLPYHLLLGIWFEFVNVFITIAWSFADLLIMVMSLGIAYRFEQFNFRLQYFRKRARRSKIYHLNIIKAFDLQIVPEETWEQIRMHYVSLCELQEFIDIKLSELIVFASLNDIYSICATFLDISM